MTNRSSNDLIRAVEEGAVDEASSLIATFGLSHSKAWSGGYTLLCEALERKHTKIAKILLEHGSRVNSSVKRKTNTPLHFAVRNKDAEMVAMLLNREANVDARNSLGETPLHLSIEKNNNSKIVSLLLNKNADVTAKNKRYETPLQRAIDVGNVEIVELFWRNDAGTHVGSSKGMNVLHIVAEFGITKVMEHLLNIGAFVDVECENNGYTPLHFAAAHCREEMVKLLLKRGADINARTKEKSTAFHLAARMSSDKIVKVLLEHKGVDIDAEDDRGKTALNVAIGRGHLPTIRNILTICPQLNNQKNRHFIRDYMCGPHYNVIGPSIVKIFISHGFGVHPEDAGNRKLLHTAIEGGCIQIVEVLLRYGADVGSPHLQKNGYTLLHNAANNIKHNIAEMLIKHGADVNAIDETGNSPISYAINRLNAKMTKLLVSSGAEIKFNPDVLRLGMSGDANEIIKMMLDHDVNHDIMAKGVHGKTALWYVMNSKNEKKIKYGRIEQELAELLLSRGANVNAKDEGEESLLCTAVKRGCDHMVAILLKYKADVNFATKINMKTPLHYSVTRNAPINEQISRMLLRAGAACNTKDKMGKTALHYACRNGAKKNFDTLLEFGAEIDHKDRRYSTPLHDAAFNGSLKIVEALLNKSFADVDCTDKHGKTALHVASEHGLPKVVKELLDFGADPNVLCKKGHLAIDYTNPGLFQYRKDLDLDPDDPYHDDSDDSSFLRDRCAGITADMIKQHIIKIKSLNIHGSKRNLESVELNDEIKDFQAKCEDEVGLMKRERIGKTYISCYDVLMKSTHQMAMIARNEDIVKSFKSSRYQKKFPIYYKMLYYKFKNGQKRENLLNPSLRFFNFLPGFSLPEIVLWKTR